ncbi:MAG: glycosyltransferase family 1 protein [Deltaproteobacteria bacterium]|nr:MAG: glycosyltransferase family 1 protein [Deltaproteobacteria bacterium]
MRVIVTGLVATYPVGGVAWDYLQYVQAFHALGCDVHYLEDTGQWVYDPAAQTFTADVGANLRYLAGGLASLDPALERRWTVRGPDGTLHGRTEAELAALCAGTELFLNISGSCWLREPYRAARVKAYVDTDPCYSQARIAAVDAGVADESTRFSVDLMRRHDVFFTNGEHVGAPDCLVPTCGIRWHPTRQPIALANWPVRSAPDGPFTTVMSWKIEPTPPVVGGRTYGGKDVEFERFLDLPARTPETLEVALAGAAPRDRIAAAGWRLREGHTVSATMAAYRDYVLGSRGELSVAKNAYVATRSGWFSTRSAAYLACGKPVVVQETGFSAHVPTGPGLHAFSTAAEAVTALAAIRADYARACAHARDTAEAYFAGDRICARLLADAGL